MLLQTSEEQRRCSGPSHPRAHSLIPLLSSSSPHLQPRKSQGSFCITHVRVCCLPTTRNTWDCNCGHTCEAAAVATSLRQHSTAHFVGVSREQSPPLRHRFSSAQSSCGLTPALGLWSGTESTLHTCWRRQADNLSEIHILELLNRSLPRKPSSPRDAKPLASLPESRH